MAEYATVGSILGNYSAYKPSTQQKIDVVFQPDLSNGYYSALALNPMGGNGIGYDLDQDIDISGQEQNGNKEEKPIYSIGKNPINGLFIGTVTVLGLFVLYRMLQK